MFCCRLRRRDASKKAACILNTQPFNLLPRDLVTERNTAAPLIILR